MDIILLPILNIIIMVISLYTWVIIAQAVLSWLIAFQILNMGNRIVERIGYALYALTEPVLRPIRRILPNFGAIDLSPIVLLLALWLLQDILARLALKLSGF